MSTVLRWHVTYHKSQAAAYKSPHVRNGRDRDGRSIPRLKCVLCKRLPPPRISGSVAHVLSLCAPISVYTSYQAGDFTGSECLWISAPGPFKARKPSLGYMRRLPQSWELCKRSLGHTEGRLLQSHLSALELFELRRPLLKNVVEESGIRLPQLHPSLSSYPSRNQRDVESESPCAIQETMADHLESKGLDPNKINMEEKLGSFLLPSSGRHK